MERPSDEELLDAVAQDPQEGIAQVLERYGPLLLGRLRRHAFLRGYGDLNVDDVFQEAILRLLDPECRQELREAGGEILPWLSRRGYWRLDDAGRKAGRHQELSEALNLKSEAPENADESSASALALALREILPLLSPRDRRILKMRYEESFSTQQIAERLSISAGAAKKAAHDARERLRNHLLAAGIQLE